MSELIWLRNPHELKTSLDDLLLTEGAAGDCLAPIINDGDMLYIDPALEPAPGDYVSLQLPSAIEGTDIDTCVKQLQIAVGPDGTDVKLICNRAGRFRLVDEKIEGVVVALIRTGRKSAQGHLVSAATDRLIERIKHRQSAA